MIRVFSPRFQANFCRNQRPLQFSTFANPPPTARPHPPQTAASSGAGDKTSRRGATRTQVCFEVQEHDRGRRPREVAPSYLYIYIMYVYVYVYVYVIPLQLPCWHAWQACLLCVCVCVHIYIYIYSRLGRLCRLIGAVRE